MAGAWRREGKPISQVVLPRLRGSGQYAVDKATRLARDKTKSTIQAAGLGRLANAVGWTSSKQKGASPDDENAWGAVYARGKTEGRGNQALMAYSQGAVIFPTAGKKWLAFASKAIPTRSNRFKMTPARYNASGLTESIGKLRFVATKNPRVAFLVAVDVTVSRKSGRAKGFAGRTPRGSDREKSVIAFVLIRYTSRARRFSQKEIMQFAVASIPGFAAEYNERGG